MMAWRDFPAIILPFSIDPFYHLKRYFQESPGLQASRANSRSLPHHPEIKTGVFTWHSG